MSRRATPRKRAKPAADAPALSPRTALALLVAGMLLGCTVAGWLPEWLAGWLLLVSLWTFGAYWRDKRAAIRAQPRVSERRLQVLALLGGWPGALFAQSLLHHKNRKVSFQQVFWVCAAANAACTLALLRAFSAAA
ncbi:MAG: DUF1294 domain-containing protein [Stenotrophomonas chelatiphaga]|uniref:DUF1294 domain-containing protein n=1 Tax=Stenotrophomonas TaxID=40323 RepID=UPI000A972BC5|nr:MULTISPECIES: DUF1294 domain-containing protein [Stenotrophomonas]MCS4232397.1 uncharacterized membrane protein YsdA (DUF1294 family) [Stenotrophomonas chelatiphaga]MDR6093967.1 uncharacterized membrane protein YsdA (DUF1294 family) [Stenotrophomonas sp. SORGH_AS_0321]ROQ42345.1 uncharacterized membrane protein YsdA (DUF1294 family) [Stenotrophomonas maltophilia]